MDIENKKNILKQLAKKEQDTAVKALEKEARKIAHILNKSNDYKELADNIEFLKIIAYRVYETSVHAVKDFLQRERTIELSYPEDSVFTNKYINDYYSFFNLAANAIKVIDHIRYHTPDQAINILFKYSLHENEKISNQAQNSLVDYSKYHIEIFFANKHWGGLGLEPQERLLEKIHSLNKAEKYKHFELILKICRNMLSTEAEGTSQTYSTMTIHTAAIPVTSDLITFRETVLNILQSLYGQSLPADKKMSIINTMYESWQTPIRVKYDDELTNLTKNNSVFVLNFLKKILKKEELEIVQEIEHDLYWKYRHSKDTEIHALVLEIKSIIDKNSEYQIFKILIGFKGIFSEWNTKEENSASRDIEEERKIRTQQVNEFAISVNEKNYAEWRNRIIKYAQIESNDLATFPYFGQFLESLSTNNPNLAIRLISTDKEKIERFLVAILIGLSNSSRKRECSDIILQWVENKEYLEASAKFIGHSKHFDKGLTKAILEAAKTAQNLDALILILSSISRQYTKDDKEIIETAFIPAIEELTKNKNSNWVYNVWFRREQVNLISDLSEEQCSAILENLIFAEKISYQHEEVLANLAVNSPQKVFEFFCERSTAYKSKKYSTSYEAIPYNLHENLTTQLKNIPEDAIDITLKNFDGDLLSLMFQEGKLLANIYSDVSHAFERKLIDLIRQNDEEKIKFVLGVLRGYDGEVQIQNICKELIITLPKESYLLTETMLALQSSGTVTGEYGFVDTYKRKIEEIKPWLNDNNDKIKDFASNYIDDLEKQIEHEVRRADEKLALRKHEYGE